MGLMGFIGVLGVLGGFRGFRGFMGFLGFLGFRGTFCYNSIKESPKPYSNYSPAQAGVNLNATDKDGETPADAAARKQRPEALKLILEVREGTPTLRLPQKNTEYYQQDFEGSNF